eukprot:5427576-Amphidinium_carterae.2
MGMDAGLVVVGAEGAAIAVWACSSVQHGHVSVLVEDFKVGADLALMCWEVKELVEVFNVAEQQSDFGPSNFEVPGDGRLQLCRNSHVGYLHLVDVTASSLASKLWLVGAAEDEKSLLLCCGGCCDVRRMWCAHKDVEVLDRIGVNLDGIYVEVRWRCWCWLLVDG